VTGPNLVLHDGIVPRDRIDDCRIDIAGLGIGPNTDRTPMIPHSNGALTVWSLVAIAFSLYYTFVKMIKISGPGKEKWNRSETHLGSASARPHRTDRNRASCERFGPAEDRRIMDDARL
jgi:hypothetical protein